MWYFQHIWTALSLLTLCYGQEKADGQKSITECVLQYVKYPLCDPYSHAKIHGVLIAHKPGGSCYMHMYPIQSGTCSGPADDALVQEVKNKCENRSACEELYVGGGPLACSGTSHLPGGEKIYNEITINYTCESSREKLLYLRVPADHYVDRRMCDIGSVMILKEVYAVIRNDASSTLHSFGIRDCVRSLNQSELAKLYKKHCNNRVACFKVHVPKERRVHCAGKNDNNAEYVDISYTCSQVTKEPRTLVLKPGEHMDKLFCPVGTTTNIHEGYYVIPRGPASSQSSIGAHDCVTPSSVSTIVDSCNGWVSCKDSLIVLNGTAYCEKTSRQAEEYHILYTCQKVFNARHRSTICPGSTNQTQSCPGGTNLYIHDVLLGYGTNRPCTSRVSIVDDCVRHLDDVGKQSHQKLIGACNGTESCEVNAVLVNSSTCSGQTYSTNDYMLITYECRSEINRLRYCTNDNITANCSTGNLLHVNKVLLGYSNSGTCTEQINDKSSCNVDVSVLSQNYFDNVISACEGRQGCEEGLVAAEGTGGSSCTGGSNSVTSHYVMIEFYCYPGTPYGDNIAFGDQLKSSDMRIISIVVPIVLVILIVIIIIVVLIVLKRKRKKPAANSGQDKGSGEVVYMEALPAYGNSHGNEEPVDGSTDGGTTGVPDSSPPLYVNYTANDNEVVREARGVETNQKQRPVSTELYAEVRKPKKRVQSIFKYTPEKEQHQKNLDAVHTVTITQEKGRGRKHNGNNNNIDMKDASKEGKVEKDKYPGKEKRGTAGKEVQQQQAEPYMYSEVNKTEPNAVANAHHKKTKNGGKLAQMFKGKKTPTNQNDKQCQSSNEKKRENKLKQQRLDTSSEDVDGGDVYTEVRKKPINHTRPSKSDDTVLVDNATYADH